MFNDFFAELYLKRYVRKKMKDKEFMKNLEEKRKAENEAKEKAYRESDEKLEREYNAEYNSFLTLPSYVFCYNYYYVDEETLKIVMHYEKQALYILWKRADVDFVKLAGYDSFTEFFEKEAYVYIGPRNRNEYYIEAHTYAHILPDEFCKVRVDPKIRFTVKANSRHGEIVVNNLEYTPEEMGELEGTDRYRPIHAQLNGRETFRAVDYASGRGDFEKREEYIRAMNIYASLRAYINGEEYTPISKYDPDRIERAGDIEWGNNDKPLLFYPCDGRDPYLLNPRTDVTPYTITFRQEKDRYVEKDICHTFFNELIEHVLKKEHCRYESNYMYHYRVNSTPEYLEKAATIIDFEFDRIETPEGNSMKIDDLPPLELIESGKAIPPKIHKAEKETPNEAKGRRKSRTKSIER